MVRPQYFFSALLFLSVSTLIGTGQAVAAASPLSFTSRGMNLKRELVAEKVGRVWGLVFLPSGELLMTLKAGSIKVFDPRTKTFKAVTGGPRIADHGQGGLHDVALSVDFAKNKLVYFAYAKEVAEDQYTTALGYGQLENYEIKDFKEIFVAQPPSERGQHFGGRIVIDSNSNIWLSVGERNERDNAQMLTNHLGKILRLTAEGKPHPENPFVGKPGVQPEIYSYGHRNPQGLAWNTATNQLWEHEHGPRGGDEINHIQKGLNYGWPKATYGAEYWGPSIGKPELPGIEGPLHHWTPSIAPSGMVIYDGEALPGWKGLVLSGAMAKTHLNLVEIKPGKKPVEERLFEDEDLRVREVEQGPGGDVWYATDNGNLFRIYKAN